MYLAGVDKYIVIFCLEKIYGVVNPEQQIYLAEFMNVNKLIDQVNVSFTYARHSSFGKCKQIEMHVNLYNEEKMFKLDVKTL